MDPDSWLAIVLIPPSLLLLALDSAVDTALTNISRLRLHQLLERGVPRAEALADLMGNPQRLPLVLLVVNMLATLVLGGMTTTLVLHYWPDWPAVPLLIGLALLVLISAVLVPRSLARRNPERAALTLYPYTRGLLQGASGLADALDALAAALARLIGGGAARPGPFVTEEEMRTLVNVSESDGVIEPAEEKMITSVFAFGDKSVREVMVPRPDIHAAPADASVSDVVDVVLKYGHTRIPIYRETIDDIAGTVNAKDLLRAMHAGRPDAPLSELIRPPYYAPETQKVDDLLRAMQESRIQLAIVVDEYGGTAGLVTVEDLIEEIVGEIHDEYDVETPLVEPVADHLWRCDARLPLDDLNELLHTTWEGEDVDTLGGFVFSRLGRIPGVGDTITVDDVTIAVLSTQGRRLKKLLVRRGQPAAPEAETPPPLPPAIEPAPPEPADEPGTRQTETRSASTEDRGGNE